MVKCVFIVVFWLVGLAPALAGIAVVSNENSGSLSFIDTATDIIVGELITCGKPRSLALSKDGKSIYVSEQTKGQLLVVDAASRKIVHSIMLGESPEAIYTSPDGKWLATSAIVRGTWPSPTTAQNAMSPTVGLARCA